jgi:hypothetical protein
MSRKSHPRPQRLRIDRAVIASGIRARCSAPSAPPHARLRLVRSPPAAPRTRTRRWFCSMGCQAAFTRKAKRGLSMVDFTEEETQALPAVMRALAPRWSGSAGTGRSGS